MNRTNLMEELNCVRVGRRLVWHRRMWSMWSRERKKICGRRNYRYFVTFEEGAGFRTAVHMEARLGSALHHTSRGYGCTYHPLRVTTLASLKVSAALSRKGAVQTQAQTRGRAHPDLPTPADWTWFAPPSTGRCFRGTGFDMEHKVSPFPALVPPPPAAHAPP